MKKMNLLSGCLAAAIITVGMCGAVMGADTVRVVIDGKPLETKVSARLENGRTMVPMRGVFEALEAEINWDEASKTVTAKKGNTVIKMTAGSQLMEKNGKKEALDAPVKIVEGVTMVPLRAVSESFDCKVEWDGAGKAVNITARKNEDAPEIPQWIKSVSTQIKRPPSIKHKLGDKQAFTAHDNGRYSFERYALRRAFLSDDNERARAALKSDGAFNAYIREIWTGSVGTPLQKAYLGFAENIRTKACKSDEGYAGIIAVAEDGADLSCAYIAVLYDEDRGFRIYTLESNAFTNGYRVCLINARGRESSAYGLDGDMAETPEMFLYTVGLIEENR